MAWPVVIVASGGLPVTLAANGFGTPYEEAENGFGVPVTFVDSGGLPVVEAVPVPPLGYVFLVDSDGYYLVDSDGYYLAEPI